MNRSLAIMALFGLCLTSCSSSESVPQVVNTDESYGIVGFEDGSFIVQQFTLQSSESGKLNVGCYYDEKANYQCIGKGDTSDSSGKPIDLTSTSLIAEIDAKHASDCDMHAVVVFGIKFDAPTLNTDDLCYYGNASKTVYVYKGKEISKDEAFAIMDKAREDYLSKFKERKAKAVDEFAKCNPGLLTQKQIDEGKESFEGFKVHLGVCKYNRFIESNKDYLEYVEIADYYRSGGAESNCNVSLDNRVIVRYDDKSDNCKKQTIYFNSKEELESQQSHGVTDEMMASVDFSKETVVLLSTGETPSSAYRLQLTQSCDGELLLDRVWCAGEPTTDDIACPVIIAKLPIAQYVVKYGEHAEHCEASH